jgi:hypothetical protein
MCATNFSSLSSFSMEEKEDYTFSSEKNQSQAATQKVSEHCD